MLGFGDGSAPPAGLAAQLLKVGITSEADDLYFADRLHDGSLEHKPKGTDAGNIAAMPPELLLQGFRGRRDDPFPQRFHTVAEKRLGKKAAAKAAKKAAQKQAAEEAAAAKKAMAGLEPSAEPVKDTVLDGKASVSEALEQKATKVPRAPTWAMDPMLDGLLKLLSNEAHPVAQTEEGFAEICRRVRSHIQNEKRKRQSNRRLRAIFNAARRTPEFMAKVVEVRSNSGRNVMRSLSLIERYLSRGSTLAKWVGATRQSLHDASHYGQSRFRSQLIAICFILTGQMHAIAAFTSAGGAGKRVSYDPAISYFEMKITEFFAPLQAHVPSDGGFLFASFLTNACVFTVYALNLFIASVGNVQNSSRFALVVSTVYCCCATIYQFPHSWIPEVYDFVSTTFSDVAPSFILDAETPGLDENVPGQMQLVTLSVWGLITFIYLTHLVAETLCGKDFWRRWRWVLSFLPLPRVLKPGDRRHQLPAMLVGAGCVEVMFNLAIVAMMFQVRYWLLDLADDADDQLSELMVTLDSNRYYLQMMFNVADHAGTVATATAGVCPGSVSSLSTIVSDACSNRGLCTDLYRSVDYVLDTIIPTTRRLSRPTLEALSIMLLVASFLTLLLTLKGLKSTADTYRLTYKLLKEHGPAAFRFPLRKADSVRLLSTMIAYNALGSVLVCAVLSLVGLVVALLLNTESADATEATSIALMLRTTIARAVVAMLCEMTYMRTVLIPFFQHHECGVALFVIELWYLRIGLLKGIARLVAACQLVILSSFTPHACIFPDGKEAGDSAHVAFVCYVMERVRQDQQRERDLARTQVVIATTFAEHHKPTGRKMSMQHLNVRISGGIEETVRNSLNLFSTRRFASRRTNPSVNTSSSSRAVVQPAETSRESGASDERTLRPDLPSGAACEKAGSLSESELPVARSRDTDDLKVENMDEADGAGRGEQRDDAGAYEAAADGEQPEAAADTEAAADAEADAAKGLGGEAMGEGGGSPTADDA